MRATTFEFERRFWVIGLIFFVGFSLTWVDHSNAAASLLRLAAPSPDPDSPRAILLLKLIFGFAAALVFLVGAMWLFLYRLIRREEHALLLTQGEPYRAYLKAVPRLNPALRPRIPAGGRRPRWGQAFAGEMFFWLIGVAVLAFAITLILKLMGLVFGLSFVVYFVAVHLVKKQAAKPAE